MRSILAWFTVRGASFLAAGLVGILAGLTLGSDAMVSVGAMLVCLPVFSAMTARRARYQLRCDRKIIPQRVAPGHVARVVLRLENVSRLSTGLLLAEDAIPYSLGARPRYVLNGIERGGSREVSYQLRSDLRGKFQVGPMRVRIADVFGLVELTANFATRSTLTVTPKVVPLISASTTGSWSSDGDGRTRMTAAAGDDDVIPRAYRDGDELRRVHWRAAARDRGVNLAFLGANALFRRTRLESTAVGGDRLVVTVGLHDVIIVDTPDALLVCARDRAEEGGGDPARARHAGRRARGRTIAG